MEWFGFTNSRGQVRERRFLLTRSLVNVKCGFSEKNVRCEKLGEGEVQHDEQPQVPSQRKTSRASRWHAPTSASPRASTSSRRVTASLANTSTGPHNSQTPRAGGDSIRSRLVSTCSRTARNGKASRRPLWATVLEETNKPPGRTRGRGSTKIAELFADERCSQAILDFLATTDVGRTAGPPVAEE